MEKTKSGPYKQKIQTNEGNKKKAHKNIYIVTNEKNQKRPGNKWMYRLFCRKHIVEISIILFEKLLSCIHIWLLLRLTMPISKLSGSFDLYILLLIAFDYGDCETTTALVRIC